MIALVDFVPAVSVRAGDVVFERCAADAHATRLTVTSVLASSARVRLAGERGVVVVARDGLVAVPARGAR